VDSGDTLTISNSINGTGGVNKTGAGTLVLSGSNSYSGATTVNAGVLQANNANALGSNTTVTVNGGSLLVSADDAINGKNITLNSASTAGLAFSGNYSGNIGKLTLQANSIIDLGTGNSVVAHFAELAFLNDSILKIYNWSGTTLWEGGTGNNTDQIYFASGASGNLDRISFYSDFGNAFLGNGYQILGGEFANQVIPVPEPETWATGALLLLWTAFWAHRKYRRRPTGA
jgi:autotransporter-associated beta strand protein